MFLLYMFFWWEVQFSGRVPQGGGSPGKRSAAEGSSAQFGPLYGNLESAPSGSIIIMEDDTPDVLIRYVGRGSAGTGWRLPVRGRDFEEDGVSATN